MSTFGVIIGNRGFFPDVLARDGREEIFRVLAERGHKAFCLTPEESKFGSVETFADARRCADLFRSHSDEIDGVVVSLPNLAGIMATYIDLVQLIRTRYKIALRHGALDLRAAERSFGQEHEECPGQSAVRDLAKPAQCS